MYVISFGAGLLVGIVYSLLNVRSPAPPLVALVGLLGILAGEQVVPMGKAMFAGHRLAAAWQHARSEAHIFGLLPGRHADAAAQAQETERHS
jgi:XapX domain-containing protein